MGESLGRVTPKRRPAIDHSLRVINCAPEPVSIPRSNLAHAARIPLCHIQEQILRTYGTFTGLVKPRACSVTRCVWQLCMQISILLHSSKTAIVGPQPSQTCKTGAPRVAHKVYSTSHNWWGSELAVSCLWETNVKTACSDR